MDVSSAKWLSDLGMDEYSIIHQYHMDSLADHHLVSPRENLKPSFSDISDNSYSSYPTFPDTATAFSGSSPETTVNHQPCFDDTTRPIKQLKTTNCNPTGHLSSSANKPNNISSPNSHFLSFDGSLKAKLEVGTVAAASPAGSIYFPTTFVSEEEQNCYSMAKASHGSGNKRCYSTMKTPSMAQDHIMAERKRREKLSQRFIALSGIVPGLKKMDKASVLGDTIKYVKELQERVKILEEQTKKRTVESVVLVRKSQVVSTDDESSSCDDENSDTSCCDSSLPEIEARASDKDILIRIHSIKQKGLLPKILSEVEMLRLSSVNSSVIPFGDSTIDITIIAQKNADFSMTITDLVKELRATLLKFT